MSVSTNRSPRKKSWSLLIFIVKVLAFNGKNYLCTRKIKAGCSSARLEYASGGRVVAGSNPVIPTKAEIKGVKSMA